MTEKQKLATQRNHNKMRLMGFTINVECMSQQEKDVWSNIKSQVISILRNYDDTNTEMGLKKTRHQCQFCFNRISISKTTCNDCLKGWDNM